MEDLDSDDIESCLEQFRVQDADREAFLKVTRHHSHFTSLLMNIQRLLRENRQLKVSLQSTTRDYADQSQSRRSWQAKAEDLETQLKKALDNTVRDPVSKRYVASRANGL